MKYQSTLTMLMPLLLTSSLLFPACKKNDHVTSNEKSLKTKIIAAASENHLPTLSVLIRFDDKDILTFDYKDRDRNVQPVQRYGLASATKFLSALVILHYVEEGKLKLDVPIGTYINLSFLDKAYHGDQVTIRQLLNHTSGIPDYTHHPSWISLVMAANPPKSVDDKLKLVPAFDPAFVQGRFMYSNTNYVILEKILEAVTGQKGTDIFNAFYSKLGLTQTSFNRHEGLEQAFFSSEKNKTGNISTWQEAYGFEAGAYSTVTDMARLLQLVFVDKTVIGNATLAEFQQWTDMDKYKVNYGYGETANYGLGLMQLKVKNRIFIGHPGSTLKYQSFIYLEPATGKQIVLMTNCSGQQYNNAFFITLIGKIIDDI